MQIKIVNIAFNRTVAFYHKQKLKTETSFLKSGWIAHHGIQRSGTNYLLFLLHKNRLRVINRLDPARDQAGHKHFRYYNDKSIIPAEIAHQYGNDVYVSNTNKLNMICNYPADTKHIVIYKSSHTSLVSLLNWGLRVNWFSSKKEAIDAAGRFLADIIEYNRFWSGMSEQEPQNVQMICYERVVQDGEILRHALAKLGFRIESSKFYIDELPQSPKERKNFVSFNDVSHLFQSKE